MKLLKKILNHKKKRPIIDVPLSSEMETPCGSISLFEYKNNLDADIREPISHGDIVRNCKEQVRFRKVKDAIFEATGIVDVTNNDIAIPGVPCGYISSCKVVYISNFLLNTIMLLKLHMQFTPKKLPFVRIN